MLRPYLSWGTTARSWRPCPQTDLVRVGRSDRAAGTLLCWGCSHTVFQDYVAVRVVKTSGGDPAPCTALADRQTAAGLRAARGGSAVTLLCLPGL